MRLDQTMQNGETHITLKLIRLPEHKVTRLTVEIQSHEGDRTIDSSREIQYPDHDYNTTDLTHPIAALNRLLTAHDQHRRTSIRLNNEAHHD